MSIQNDPLENRSHDDLIKTIRRILQESEELSSRMMTITNIGIEMSRTLDFDDILNIVTRKAKWLINFEHCSVLIINPYGQWEARILVDKHDAEHDFKVTNTVIRDVINTGKSKILNQTDSDFLSQYPHKLLIPLTSENQVMGTIHFAGTDPFDHEDLRIGLFLGLQLASAIDKANRLQVLMITQQQLADYAKELTIQNEEIETYNHTIAHDLKSPLSTIPLKVGLIKMLEPNLKSGTVQHLEDISDRVNYIAEMIEQLLILSKLRDDTETMLPVNVQDVVARCLERFSEIELGEVKVVVQEDLPAVIGHAQWLEEIFANLISNAIKYMGDKNTAPEICISATVADHEATYSVKDNGVGIRKEDQQRLFKEFTRLKDVQAEGLGLGLSIVHRIVDRFGGKLGVESDWGKGTTFWFTIPTPVMDTPQSPNSIDTTE